jgi:hypothetical protein
MIAVDRAVIVVGGGFAARQILALLDPAVAG